MTDNPEILILAMIDRQQDGYYGILKLGPFPTEGLAREAASRSLDVVESSILTRVGALN